MFASVGTPEPGGLMPEQVVAMVTALASRYEIAGVGITEYEPARPQDQETLAGLVGAVVEAAEASVVREVERRAFAAWPAGVVREEARLAVAAHAGGGAEAFELRRAPTSDRRSSTSRRSIAPATGP